MAVHMLFPHSLKICWLDRTLMKHFELLISDGLEEFWDRERISTSAVSDKITASDLYDIDL